MFYQWNRLFISCYRFSCFHIFRCNLLAQGGIPRHTNIIKVTALKCAMFYWGGQDNRYLICYTFVRYGSQGWHCTTLRLLYVFLETLTMASPPAHINSACPWQTFAHVSEKQLLEGSRLPLELQRLPHLSLFVMTLENINSQGTGDI